MVAYASAAFSNPDIDLLRTDRAWLVLERF